MKQHLREHIYLDVKPIIAYVRETFGVQYSVSGMTKLLHELNFVSKKPKNCPSKADLEQQRKWMKKHRKPRKNVDKNDISLLWTEFIRNIKVIRLMVGLNVELRRRY